MPVLIRQRIGYRPTLALRTPGHAQTGPPRQPAYRGPGRNPGRGPRPHPAGIRVAPGSIAAYYYAQLIMVYMPRSLFSGHLHRHLPPWPGSSTLRDLSGLRATAARGIQAAHGVGHSGSGQVGGVGAAGVRFLFPGRRLGAAGMALVCSLMLI
ncbi:MAG: hypothetical protein R2854_13920 [Caldilineaceae bacterium]